jgi:hypothetical protein
VPSSKKPTASQLLTEAIGALRAGTGPRPDLADAVQELAEQRLRNWTGAGGTIVSFRADSDLLAKVGDGRLSQVAEQGCQRFLEGQLEPARTVRAAAGTKAPTSVRIDDGLLARVDTRCKELSTQVGWKVRPVNVFVAAFEADTATRE